MQTESVARALSTDSGLLSEGVPMLRDMALEAISGEKIVDAAKQQLMGVAGQVAERIPTLSEATTKWLDQYQKGRFEVTIDTSELSKEVSRLTRLGREIVIAVMLVGMLVGSAVASYGIAAVELHGWIWDLLARIAPDRLRRLARPELPDRAEAHVALAARRLSRRGLTGGLREEAPAACRRRLFSRTGEDPDPAPGPARRVAQVSAGSGSGASPGGPAPASSPASCAARAPNSPAAFISP